MMDDYPTDEELEKIAAWPTKDPMGWVTLVSRLWNYGPPYIRRTQRRWYLSTGGWSGNEDIIGAMRRSYLWGFSFVSHRRGGHYVLDMTVLRMLRPKKKRT